MDERLSDDGVRAVLEHASQKTHLDEVATERAVVRVLAREVLKRRAAELLLTISLPLTRAEAVELDLALTLYGPRPEAQREIVEAVRERLKRELRG